MKYGQAKLFAMIVLFISSLFFVITGCKTDNALFICPIDNLKETGEDCPWAGITRRLNAAGESENTIKNILKRYSPGLLKSVIKDAKKTYLKSLWGRSINYDEMKKEIIVKPSILDVLLKLSKVPAPTAGKIYNGKKLIVHAGIEHTYGYLLSNLQTAYGYKRARWVKDDIEVGLKLPRGILGPKPESGTLFTNITYFLSQIAFRSEPDLLYRLITCGAPEALKNFSYKNLKIKRLEETVNLEKNRNVILRTDLVEFVKKQAGKPNDHLLVYSFSDSSMQTSLLITAFPVSSGFVKGIFKTENLGKNKLIKTRYNAFIAGFTDSGKFFRGIRIERR